MLKYISTLVIILFTLCHAFGQTQLFPKRLSNGKYGYVDQSSSLVIKASFDKAFSFNGNVAKVIKDGKWGLINKNGDYFVKPNYHYIGWSDDGFYQLNKNHLSLSSNLLPKGQIFQNNKNGYISYLLNGKWGLIRPNGKNLKDEWDSINFGGEDLFPVYLNGNGWTWIDAQGHEPKSLFFKEVKTLSNNLIGVKNESDSKYYLHDKEGLKLIEMAFKSVSNFNDELIKVSNDGLWGLANSQAEIKFDIVYEDIKFDQWNKKIQLLSFSPWIELKDLRGKIDTLDFKPLYFIDQDLLVIEKEEKRLVQNIIDDTYSNYPSKVDTILDDGMFLKARSKSFDGYRLYDKNLDLLIDQDISEYHSSRSDSFIFLLESARKKWLLFDIRNKNVVLHNIDEFEFIENELAIIGIGDLSGLFDLTMKKWVIKNQYDRLERLNDSCFIGSLDNDLFLHFSDTFYTYQNALDEFKLINDSLFAIRKKGKWSLRDMEFKNILNQDFEDISPSELDLIRVKRQKKWGLYNLKNKKQALSFKYDTIGPLKLNIRVVKSGKEIGITNEIGYFTYPLREYYDYVDQFDQEWANAAFNGLAAKIDKLGNFKISSQYETIGPNIKDHFTFQFRLKWGLLDKRERIVIQPLYDSLFILNESFVKVWKNGKCGIKDFSDKNLIEIEFDQISINEFGYFYVVKDQNMGLFNSAPRQLRPPTYEKIIQYEKNRIGLKKNGYWQIIDENGVLVLDKKYSQILYNNKSKSFYLKEQKPWQIVKLN
jgi:hypothetical protein